MLSVVGMALLSFIPSFLLSVEPEPIGYKYFKNFRANDYNNSPQNRAIAQDKQGIIYVANQGGPLEFDGISWRSYEIPNQSVYSLAVDDNGTIFIGGADEFGYMAPDAAGTLQYKSLRVHFQDKQINFGNVWATYAAKEGIYFQASKYLFCWRKGKLKVWESGDGIFHTSFYYDGNLFIRQEKVGLLHIVKGSLKLLPEGEKFAAIEIYMMAPYNEKKLLLGTRSNGLFLFDGTNLEPFPTEADAYLNEKLLYHGINLKSSPGQFALATRQGGVVIIDGSGRLKAVYNTNDILPDSGVKYVFEDIHGNLWLALNRGISKIEYHSPFSFFDERTGLPGMVLSIERYNDTLYVGTYNELFSLDLDGRFLNVLGITSPCWSLFSTGKTLLAATTHGLLQVGEKAQEKVLDGSSYVLVHSQKNTRRIWVGTRDGLVSLFLEKERWLREHKFVEIKNTIRTIVEDKDGNLWLGLTPKEVIKVDFPTPASITNPIIRRFGKEDGLPDQEIRVFWAAGHVMFTTESGLFRFDEKKKNFIPDSTLGPDYTNGTNNVFCLAEDNERNIWFHSMLRNIEAIPSPGEIFTLNKKPFLRLPRVQTNAIFPDSSGNATWFATNDVLIRYDTKIDKKYDLNFSAIIRKVTVNGKPVFDGGHSQQPRTIFPFRDRNLRFQFAAPFFEGESETRFRTFLEGYEKKWSEWTPEPQKEYTNLNSGSYTFRVQAKNVYENLSSEATFQFKVLPPWYKTWWAFLGYAIFAFYLVFLLIKWRSGKLEREKQVLEQIVKERTQEIEARNIEINEKNLQLESQTTQLKEQSGKLQEMDKIKSRFFANISHEFRTPLTLIMGPLEQMIAACRGDDVEEKRKLTLMLRNAQRLLRLINQLLELSKLDSGKMKLHATKTDIIAFLKGIIDSFRLLAQQNELDLVFQAETENQPEAEEFTLYLDARKMEDIMANLLVNAIKFTPAGGKITVTLRGVPESPGCASQDFVEISVSDTGPGIPARELPFIFDRFYQVESTYEIHQKGTGIGLALAKELVELHHGTIEARTREGEGSTFIIRLLLGSNHLAPDEIAEFPSAPTQSPTPSHDITIDEITAGETETEREKEEKGTVEKVVKKEKTAPWALVNLEAVIGRDEPDIILAVEDSADMRDYIRGALEPGYTVVDAQDGREGIQKAREIIPDLIISDIMMPGVDGNELCRVLKSDVKTSHIPIILLTAKAAEENIIQGLETGADDYITKPFNTKILIARIKNLIDLRSQLQRNINREMTLQPVKTLVSTIDREFLHDLHEAIRKNLADEEFNVEHLCKKLYMGRTTLYRKVLALTGETPTDFIRSYRLKQGAELLKKNVGTVLEVALAVGFSNSSYFAKCFKEKFHQLPSEYQAASK